MIKKLFLVGFLSLSSIMFSGCMLGEGQVPAESMLPRSSSATPIIENDSLEPAPIYFTARFEIFTNGTRRIFTDAKYHNQSEDVYIENPDPHLIHVKTKDVTWANFFSTLPFSLNRNCLVTGTKQTFCTTETKKLRFYLNDVETPDVLDKVISPDDFLRVEYGSV